MPVLRHAYVGLWLGLPCPGGNPVDVCSSNAFRRTQICALTHWAFSVRIIFSAGAVESVFRCSVSRSAPDLFCAVILDFIAAHRLRAGVNCRDDGTSARTSPRKGWYRIGLSFGVIAVKGCA